MRRERRVGLLLVLMLAGSASCFKINRGYPPYLDDGVAYATPTREQQLWALATAALLTEANHGRHDLLGDCERTPENTEIWKTSLARWWGVHNREDLLDTLDWIRNGGHRKQFNQILDDISRIKPDQLKKLRQRFANNPKLKNKIEIVYQNKAAGKRYSIIAWDYDRYIALCGWGYVAGYLTEDEAWRKIMPAARLLQRTYPDWSLLAMSHIIGRKFWSLKHTRQSGRAVEQAMSRLLSKPDSPWQTIPWNLDLTPSPATK